MSPEDRGENDWAEGEGLVHDEDEREEKKLRAQRAKARQQIKETRAKIVEEVKARHPAVAKKPRATRQAQASGPPQNTSVTALPDMVSSASLPPPPSVVQDIGMSSADIQALIDFVRGSPAVNASPIPEQSSSRLSLSTTEDSLMTEGGRGGFSDDNLAYGHETDVSSDGSDYFWTNIDASMPDFDFLDS